MKRKGFTLSETVLALAVVGLLMTTFMAVFIPTRKSIHGSLAIQEADRLTSALTAELSTLRPDEQQKYNTAFDKAFDWMRRTGDAKTSIVIYNYRGDLSKPERSDGSLQPYSGREYVPGSSTMLTTAVVLAELDRARIQEDIKAITGPVFVVRMTQYVWETQSRSTSQSRPGTNTTGTQFGDRGGRYVLSREAGRISNPYQDSQTVVNSRDYMYNANNTSEPPWGSEVIYLAEFFQLPVLQSNAMRNLTYEKMKRPLFTRNLVFRR